MTTPILEMDEMVASQAGKYVTFNDAINKLDTAAGPFLLGLTYDGSPGNGEVILRHKASVAFKLPASLTGSYFYSEVAATSAATFTLKKNGSPIGTVVFSSSATTGVATFATTVSFAVGNKLTMEAPASADSTLADLGFTLKGSKVVS